MTDLQTELLANVDASIQELDAFADTNPAGFILVASGGGLAVGEAGDVLRFVSIHKAKLFKTEGEAAYARRRWNANLNADQKAARCAVIVTAVEDAIVDQHKSLIEMREMLGRANVAQAK